MSPRFLIDTNVLVFMHDPVDPVKQARACAVLERAATERIEGVTFVDPFAPAFVVENMG